MPEPDERKASYLLEEMKTARQRIDAEIAVMNQFEILSFTAIGAIYLLFFQYKIVDRGALILLAFLAVFVLTGSLGIGRTRTS